MYAGSVPSGCNPLGMFFVLFFCNGPWPCISVLMYVFRGEEKTQKTLKSLNCSYQHFFDQRKKIGFRKQLLVTLNSV